MIKNLENILIEFFPTKKYYGNPQPLFKSNAKNSCWYYAYVWKKNCGKFCCLFAISVDLKSTIENLFKIIDQK